MKSTGAAAQQRRQLAYSSLSSRNISKWPIQSRNWSATRSGRGERETFFGRETNATLVGFCDRWEVRYDRSIGNTRQPAAREMTVAFFCFSGGSTTTASSKLSEISNQLLVGFWILSSSFRGGTDHLRHTALRATTQTVQFQN